MVPLSAFLLELFSFHRSIQETKGEVPKQFALTTTQERDPQRRSNFNRSKRREQRRKVIRPPFPLPARESFRSSLLLEVVSPSAHLGQHGAQRALSVVGPC